MATITVKNIPDDLYARLKETATIHRRSINSEIIFCIENTINSKQIHPEDFIKQIDTFYQDIDVPPLTEEKLQEYKESGRL